MPESYSSRSEKPKVWKLIEKRLGPMTRPSPRRYDWRVTADGKTSVFVTYSKYHNAHECWWYDVSPADLSEWLKRKQAFIVFVMADHQKTLVVPVEDIYEHVKSSTFKRKESTGDLTLHLISGKRGYKFRELPRFAPAGYFQNYSLLNR